MKSVLLSILLASVAGLPLGCSREAAASRAAKPPPPVPVTVARVETRPVDRTLAIVGTLHAKDSATVSAEVEGRVERTLVEFGDRVTAGQELAWIDTDSHAARAHQAEARVEQAKALAHGAELELRRQQELRRNGVAAPADLDGAEAQSDQARAALKAAEATLAVARLDLERSRIRAPFDAAVADRIASVGDFVRPGSPLFRVVNDGVLKFIAQAPEGFGPQVVRDLPVVFSVDAHPGRRFEGRVFLVSPQVNLSTRMFDFGALVPNADRLLKAGTFARGELVLERAVPTRVVPVGAVLSSSGVSRVFVVDGSAARARVVKTGRVLGEALEILSGVSEGQTVVVTGHGKLADGMAVEVRP
ncbi:MAG: efflux RND transporter periplasmic adaptor subunit [Verrucomicrobium sp.]|jgi:membrane fusion protein (multidrug efflux system)|nr:efflux RND transporter periplasmic adaptor subunit [Verrucomicrobium sp.]